ncbi:MAG: hypothetical protein QXN71_00310 [Candidatus Aenigmatarchaeota archaeon]
MDIAVVNWDVDNVWYKGISTTYCAEKSTLDPKPFIYDFIKKGWFTEEDIRKWDAKYNDNKGIKTVGSLSKCLTDFFYKMKKNEKPVITRDQIIEGKQSLLRGMTIKDIIEIADSVDFSDGLVETIEDFRKRKIYQTAFSDGLGPFVCYLMKKNKMDYKGFVPAIMEIGGEEKPFEEHMLDIKDAKLTGKTLKFDKASSFFKHIEKKGHPLNVIAAIDDSGANVETLLLPIQEGGGIAVGYNPTEEHKKIFYKFSIPVLKGTDLRLFGEIVRNPGKIKDYCI